VGLQLVAGVVRVRGWFHCIRASERSCAEVRFRDVLIAHLGSSGWNGVLPVKGGEAVKIALLRRRLRSAPVGTLAGTLVPTSLVEATFTFTLLSALLAVGIASPGEFADRLPTGARVPVLVAVGACVLLGLWILWRRAPRIIRDVGAGLAVLRRPRVLFTRVIPWQLASRIVRLVAFAAVLAAAGFGLGLAPALLLMAVMGATPSVGPASAAMRAAIVSAAIPAAHSATAVAYAAQVLIAAMLASSAVNLAVSVAVLAIVLRTASPHRIAAYVRAACRRGARAEATSAP
jgi:hypothetical protein